MVSFFIKGLPAPGGSKRGLPIYRKGPQGERVFSGKVVVVETATRAQPWRIDVQAAARERWGGNPPATGPLSFEVAFLLPRPKAHYDKAGDVRLKAPRYPLARPDVTKLVRALEDALTGICWSDDCQIVQQRARKCYVLPGQEMGAMVTIETLPETADKVSRPLVVNRVQVG